MIPLDVDDANAVGTVSASSTSTSYALPDGCLVMLERACVSCPEALFRPEFVAQEGDGVHEAAYKCIMQVSPHLASFLFLSANFVEKCDVEVRKELYSNVVLAGGNTLFSGFAGRLANELRALALPRTLVDVHASTKYSAWIGGSILTSLSTFRDRWITRDDWLELGARGVHQKI